MGKFGYLQYDYSKLAWSDPNYPSQAGTVVSDYKFTDQEWDAESGLYNYDARLYDPVIGRFISADTIAPDPFDPQLLNRYSYVRSNPLIYVDPSGHHLGGYNGPDNNTSGAFGGDDGSGSNPGNGKDHADNPGNREQAEKEAKTTINRYVEITVYKNVFSAKQIHRNINQNGDSIVSYSYGYRNGLDSCLSSLSSFRSPEGLSKGKRAAIAGVVGGAGSIAIGLVKADPRTVISGVISITESSVRSFIEWGLDADTSDLPSVYDATVDAFESAAKSISNQIDRNNQEDK